ncbi:MAG: patatin-like phospholipase family protein [Candidatus Eremiobacteraeota bacterium]|nr:patatin-like phospholipase family protein [Candidatus Eremiobacteraeota bacterium]
MAFSAGDFESPDIRRLCDVVMKGGITSGVVYPTAICKLATTYAIKNIGGTSVGAIAAAITAAAEYRRRRFGSGDGYVQLAKLPGFLGQPGALPALFRPDPPARTLFRIAMIPIGAAPTWQKWLRLIGTLLLSYFWIPLLTIAVIFGVFAAVTWPVPAGALWRCLAASLVFGTVAALVGIVFRVVYQLIGVLDGNQFGWCHGYSSERSVASDTNRDVTQLAAGDVPPLFNWLEAFIAQTAGTPRAQPLTFGDLWSAPQPSWHAAAPGERCIDFRMVTTCVTLGRPFALPFDPKEQIGATPDPATDFDADNRVRPSLYFLPEDLERYFSDDILNYVKAWAAPCALPQEGGKVYWRFPAAERVPIIVATRMSMSFPVLFCAFPLYALDDNAKMQALWFSDGGLSSNFPIHFFDSPLPRWPTFAIDLLPGPPQARPRIGPRYDPGSVFMESAVPRSTVNPWNRLSSGSAQGNVLAFASALLDATRSWQDVTLGTLPGNAGRIVGIRLSPDQGGLNLNMPTATIEAMTQLGLEAGTKLVDVFASGASDAPGWKAHRWLRYLAIMGAFTRWATGYQTGYLPFGELPAQTTYEELVRGLPDADTSGVADSTQRLATLPLSTRFYDLEEPPIAVLPTRPVV